MTKARRVANEYLERGHAAAHELALALGGSEYPLGDPEDGVIDHKFYFDDGSAIIIGSVDYTIL